MTSVDGRLNLIDRVERRIDHLARQMVERFVAEVPIYRRLPREQLQGEIFLISRENLRVFFRCVREERGPTDEELAEPRASAARRAEERVPLGAVLTAYHLGGRIGWGALAAEAEPDEREHLESLADGVMAYIQAVTGAVASAYLEEQQLIYGEQRDARRSLAEALVAGGGEGEHVQALSRRAGVDLPPGYLVLALSIGPSADERDSGVAGTVAGRRKIRRVQAQLERAAGEPVLALLDAAGGPVLFPLGEDRLNTGLADSAEIVSSLASAAGADITAGIAWGKGADGVPAAVSEARDVLQLALRLGRPSGAYRLDDVLLEYTVTHVSETADRLDALLAPLRARGDLLETLEQWYEADFDRRAAAASLNVHPNTLDYRLRRVAELTGMDPGSARGVQLLGAALTANRYRHG